jgi:hypothetical protein
LASGERSAELFPGRVTPPRLIAHVRTQLIAKLRNIFVTSVLAVPTKEVVDDSFHGISKLIWPVSDWSQGLAPSRERDLGGRFILPAENNRMTTTLEKRHAEPPKGLWRNEDSLLGIALMVQSPPSLPDMLRKYEFRHRPSSYRWLIV